MIGYIYLLQPSVLRGSNKYKIGRSQITNAKRLTHYGSNVDVIAVFKVNNCIDVEKELINIFNITFKSVMGSNETYEGDINEMCRIFINVVCKTENYNIIEQNSDFISLKTICRVEKERKVNASDNKEIGEYKFYTTAQEPKFSTVYPKREEEYIIVSNQQYTRIRIDNFFTCTHDNTLIKCTDERYTNRFIYNYLLRNTAILAQTYIKITYINDIKIPKLTLDQQEYYINNTQEPTIELDQL